MLKMCNIEYCNKPQKRCMFCINECAHRNRKFIYRYLKKLIDTIIILKYTE